MSHRSPWAGTWRLARLQLRTNRAAAVAGPLVILVLIAATARSISAVYDSPAKREVYRRAIGASPASVAFNGRGYDLDGLGGIVVYELGFFALLLIPVIAIHLAVRLSRTEEDLGRADLVTAAPVGRLAPLGAAALVVAATLTTAGGLSWAGLVWAGLDRAGSGRYALILTLFLLACAALGLAAAQVGASSRGAYALAVGALVLTYLVRGVIDGQSLDGAWLTPMGWLAEVRPYGDWQLWPFALMAALSVALLAGAVAVRTHRDLGGGLLAARSGPATASPRLASPVALTWRTGRGALAAWLMGSMVWGVAFGLLTRDVQQIVSSNPDLAMMVGAGKGSVVDGVVSLSAATVALMAAALGIQIVGRAAAEEGQGRLALVLSTRVGRLRWWAGLAAVVSTQAALVLAAGGAAIGVGVWTSLGDSGYVPRGVWSTLAYFPAVLLVGAITAAAYAGGPRIAALGWAVVGWASVVAMLGDTLRLPAWARDLSPLEHTGRVPLVTPDAAALALLSVLAVVTAAAAGVRFARRDLSTG